MDRVVASRIIVVFVAFLALALFLIPGGSRVQIRSLETKSMNNAKQIGFACHTYAVDHGGNYPPSLDALFPTYLPDRSILISPFKPGEPIGYIYTPGLKDTSASYQ